MYQGREASLVTIEATNKLCRAINLEMSCKEFPTLHSTWLLAWLQ